MCRECVTEPKQNIPVVFTLCSYCEQLSDHSEIYTSEGICLQCLNCDTIMFPEQTRQALEKVYANRLKAGF